MIHSEQQSMSTFEDPGHTPEAVEGVDPNAEGVAKAEAFLKDVAPHLGRLFGMDLSIRIGNGWSTNLQTGEVTADPRFFVERGYTPDMSAYATLHEVAAHLKEVVSEPKLTAEVIEFKKKGPSESIFHNILSDIAGNNLIHAVLPKTMPKVAAEMYATKLFPDTDYSTYPRHLQFLYKIVRDEMIPDSETTTVEEVEAAITSLRDYKGKGDVIKYSTVVAKSRRQLMPATEKFKIWTDIIYPVYEELLKQDEEDPIQEPDTAESEPSDEPSGGGGSGQSRPEQPQDGQDGKDKKEQSDDESADQDGEGGDERSEDEKPSEDEGGDGSPFDKYYQDYRENKHPEPLTEEQEEEIREHAKQNPPSRDAPIGKKPNMNTIIDQRIREETGGHTFEEQQAYNEELLKWQNQIEQMRDVFKTVIDRRIADKRGLARRPSIEGAILDPNRIAQTMVDVQAGVEYPEAFRDYERRKGQTDVIGNTDYVFAFDVSPSMTEFGRSKAAASAAVIGLEGLAAMQRDIKETEELLGTDLDLEIRTAIYTFGDVATLLKPLSSTLNLKQRIETRAAVAYPNGSGTNDYLALNAINNLTIDKDRRKIVIVVSDGESGWATKAQEEIAALRANGWFVYGIGIGSDAATRLYQPTARRVDDPKKLPEVISTFIEDTIRG